jgi:hypothetical protein
MESRKNIRIIFVASFFIARAPNAAKKFRGSRFPGSPPRLEASTAISFS